MFKKLLKKIFPSQQQKAAAVWSELPREERAARQLSGKILAKAKREAIDQIRWETKIYLKENKANRNAIYKWFLKTYIPQHPAILGDYPASKQFLVHYLRKSLGL